MVCCNDMIANKSKDDEYLRNCDDSCGSECILKKVFGMKVSGTSAYGCMSCIVCHRYYGSAPYPTIPDGYRSLVNGRVPFVKDDYRVVGPASVEQASIDHKTWIGELFNVNNDLQVYPPVVFCCETCDRECISLDTLGPTNAYYDIMKMHYVCGDCGTKLSEKKEHRYASCVVCNGLMIDGGRAALNICTKCVDKYSTKYKQMQKKCKVCGVPVNEQKNDYYYCKNHKM